MQITTLTTTWRWRRSLSAGLRLSVTYKLSTVSAQRVATPSYSYGWHHARVLVVVAGETLGVSETDDSMVDMGHMADKNKELWSPSAMLRMGACTRVVGSTFFVRMFSVGMVTTTMCA